MVFHAKTPSVCLFSAVGEKKFAASKCLVGMQIILHRKESKPKRLRENLHSFPSLPNNLRGPVPGIKLSPEIYAKNISYVWWGKQNLELGVHSVSHYLCRVQQTLVCSTFAFPSSDELTSSHLKSQTTTFNILFCVLLKMIFKMKVLAILTGYFS